MKIRKILSAAAALCIAACTTFPTAYSVLPDLQALTASAIEAVKKGDLTFYLYEDHAELNRCSKEAEGDIVIPAEVEGLPVTSIHDSAMYSCKSITSLTIPEGVKSIECYAFHDCSSLTSVVIPDSLEYISNSAFYECSSLASIDFPEGLDFIGQYAFYGCESLSAIELTENVQVLYDKTKKKCSEGDKAAFGSYPYPGRRF